MTRLTTPETLSPQFDHIGKWTFKLSGFGEPSPAVIDALLGDEAAAYRAMAASCAVAVDRDARALVDAGRVDPSGLDLSAGDRLLFLGDSITDDWQSWRAIVTRAFELAGVAFERPPLDESISGATSTEVLRRARYIHFAAPTVVFVMIGTNDAIRVGRAARKSLVSIDEYRANIVEIDRHARDAGARRVVWVTQPPVDVAALAVTTRDAPIPVEVDPSRTDQYRRAVIDLFADVVDTHALAGAWSDLLLDGLHPNLAGQALIAAAVLERFRTGSKEATTSG
jgi:lysophospholipase L1-like esterase